MTMISVIAERVRRRWPTIDRTVRGYEPVMLTVAAVLAAALWLPSFGGSEPGEVAHQAVAGAPADAPAGQAGPASPPTSADGPPLASPTITGSPAPAAPAAGAGTGAAAPDTAPPGAPDAGATTPASPGPAPPRSAEVPLSVRGAGWASTLGSTLPGPVGVAEGAFPVGNRLGQVDAASFVRLAGTGTDLVLQEALDDRRSLFGEPEVAACAITDPGWPEEQGQRLDDAPVWDADRCVEGVVDDLGRWTFDLGGLGVDPTGEAGFALVPGPDAPVDFQISYRFPPELSG